VALVGVLLVHLIRKPWAARVLQVALVWAAWSGCGH
jgi:hypothetical protein